MIGICHSVLEAAGNRLNSFHLHANGSAMRVIRVSVRSACLMAGMVTKKMSRWEGEEWKVRRRVRGCGERRGSWRGRFG